MERDKEKEREKLERERVGNHLLDQFDTLLVHILYTSSHVFENCSNLPSPKKQLYTLINKTVTSTEKGKREREDMKNENEK